MRGIARLWQGVLLWGLFRLCRHISIGQLTIVLPDGSQHQFKGSTPGPHAQFTIKDRSAVGDIMRSGALGFCEAYMDGKLDSPNVMAVIELAARQGKTFHHDRLNTNWWRRWMLHISHWRARNRQKQAEVNIAQHYDRGNQFYQLWLDPSLTYSSAYFTPLAGSPKTRGDNQPSLEWGQRNKYARIAELAGIGKTSRVLEIGCGWGGFAEYAAKRHGCKVTAITISKQQHAYTRARIKNAGLAGQIEVVFMDYRDCPRRFGQRFDSVVSIEMIEAVGAEYWGVYFASIAQCLKPHGRAVLQAITIDHALYQNYRHQPDFIQRYIFPGGVLPSLPALDVPIKQAKLALRVSAGFGLDYAATLAEWRRRFQQKEAAVAGLGFDAKFRRMWELYLAYCEGGFRAGTIDVKHLILSHAPVT